MHVCVRVCVLARMRVWQCLLSLWPCESVLVCVFSQIHVCPYLQESVSVHECGCVEAYVCVTMYASSERKNVQK